MSRANIKKFLIGGVFVLVAVGLWLFFIFSQASFLANENEASFYHLPPPEQLNPVRVQPASNEVKAIYITSPVFLEKKFDEILELYDQTELNSIVVTMKSGGGVYEGEGVADLVRKLKNEGIYTIARITIFQDNALARSRPDVALKSNIGGLWRDSSGAYWVDPASKKAWDYNIRIAKETIDFGFDELNFDYIRFPSDGELSDIRYPVWDGIVPRAEVIKQFFAYLTKGLKAYRPGITLSADIFAYVLLTHIDDAGIGQRLEDAALYFDAVAPMVYPSHYSAGNFGFIEPAKHPYDVVLETLVQGAAKLENIGGKKGVMRPWLQAFNMGAVYNADMVNLEKRAVQDAGLEKGWMLWNPQNKYPIELFNISPQ